MMKWLGYSFKDQSPVEITIDGEQLRAITAVDDKPAQHFFIGPGFTDIQVNGYGGIDYNERYDDALNLAPIARLLYQAGVTTHFPTIITNSAEQITNLIRQVMTLRKQDELARWSIEGLHIEGPFEGGASKRVCSPARLESFSTMARGSRGLNQSNNSFT
jgi:N-acetylglucosamine-6-phosphate deacetylase